MSTYVSGPLNIVHLKGYVNEIEKNIYLLLDVHLNKNNEKPCENENAIDIKKLLKNIFHNANKKIDFMVEVYPSTITHYYKCDNNCIYINKVRSFTKKYFKVNEKGTVIVSDKFPNVRLHYLDVRMILMNFIGYYFIYDLKNDDKLIDSVMLKNDLNHVKSVYAEYFAYLTLFISLLNEKKIDKIKMNIFEKYDDVLLHANKMEQFKMLSYLMEKIKGKYNHKKIRTTIDNMLSQMKVYYNIISSIYFDIQKSNSMEEIFKFNDEMEFYMLLFTLYFMDCYALRRVLDKDYIETAILYVGALHGYHYMTLLVNDFDFKIINIAKNNFNSVEELNDQIKKIKTHDINKDDAFETLNTINLSSLHKFFAVDDEKQQCSNYSLLENLIKI